MYIEFVAVPRFMPGCCWRFWLGLDDDATAIIPEERNSILIFFAFPKKTYDAHLFFFSYLFVGTYTIGDYFICLQVIG